MTNVVSTNTFHSTTPTNAIFNFEKENYRVYRAGTNKTFTIYVNRTGTNTDAQTIQLYSQ